MSALLSWLCLSFLDNSEDNWNQNWDLLKLIANLSIHSEKQHEQASSNFTGKQDGRSDPDWTQSSLASSYYSALWCVPGAITAPGCSSVHMDKDGYTRIQRWRKGVLFYFPDSKLQKLKVNLRIDVKWHKEAELWWLPHHISVAAGLGHCRGFWKTLKYRAALLPLPKTNNHGFREERTENLTAFHCSTWRPLLCRSWGGC